MSGKLNHHDKHINLSFTRNVSFKTPIIMKKSTFFFVCFMAVQISFGQSVGIGTTTPAASAKLEVSSTTQGMLVPRMTTTQRTAISSPASGLLVYDLTTNSFWFKGGTAWVELIDSVTTEVHRNGPTMIYTGMTDNVGIGISTPANKLDIQAGPTRFGIQSTNRPLYVTGNFGPNGNGVEFMSVSGTQGVGFGFNTMYAAGSQASQDLGLESKGSSGVLRFTTNTVERMRINENGNVGIGTTFTNAPLQFGNVFQNRKMVLYDGANNDHQYFGLGVNVNILRYQVPNTSGSHVFYSGASSSSSNELMRIQGNGNVGIGTSAPAYKLQVMTGDGYGISHTNGNVDIATQVNIAGGLIGTRSNHPFQLYANNGVDQFVLTPSGYIGIGVYNPMATLEIARGTAPFGSLQVDGTSYYSHFDYGTPEDTYIRGGKSGAKVIINDFGDLGNVGIGTATPLQKLHVGGKLAVDNNVGIANTDPHAPLQFSNDLQNRKIVMYEGLNNDHAYYGFGVNGSILRYQVSNPGDNHVFYAADASGTSSNELMRIRGDGNVGIGTATPAEKLDVNGNVHISGTLQLGYSQNWVSSTGLNPLTSQTVSCSCPAGSIVTGGGYTSVSNSLIAYSNGPLNNTTWIVSGYNNSPVFTASFTVWAVCARMAN